VEYSDSGGLTGEEVALGAAGAAGAGLAGVGIKTLSDKRNNTSEKNSDVSGEKNLTNGAHAPAQGHEKGLPTYEEATNGAHAPAQGHEKGLPTYEEATASAAGQKAAGQHHASVKQDAGQHSQDHRGTATAQGAHALPTYKEATASAAGQKAAGQHHASVKQDAGQHSQDHRGTATAQGAHALPTYKEATASAAGHSREAAAQTHKNSKIAPPLRTHDKDSQTTVMSELEKSRLFQNQKEKSRLFENQKGTHNSSFQRK
jgi:hypothetical protein